MNTDACPEFRKCTYVFALVDRKELRPHEQVDDARIAELSAEITSDGVLRYPVIVDKGSMVILDGHHRVTVLTKLGCTFIPAYLVDYCNDGIQVASWRGSPSIAGISEITKETVVLAGLTGHLFSPKTSRHIWPWPPRAYPMPVNLLRKL